MNTKNLPHFKYNPNVYKNGMVEFGSGICQCCGEKTNAYIQNIYAIEDIDCICMNCVSSGKAAHKFNGTYIQDADWIDNPIATEELYKKRQDILAGRERIGLHAVMIIVNILEQLEQKS